MCVCDYCDALFPPILYLCLVSMPQLVARWVGRVWCGTTLRTLKCIVPRSAAICQRQRMLWSVCSRIFFHRHCNLKYLHLNTHVHAIICIYFYITHVYTCIYIYVCNATKRTWRLHHSLISANTLRINKLCGNARIHTMHYMHLYICIYSNHLNLCPFWKIFNMSLHFIDGVPVKNINSVYFSRIYFHKSKIQRKKVNRWVKSSSREAYTYIKMKYFPYAHS